ncbi:WXG100 family type VII secretion target [Nocardioides sp. Kera G14]|uniref:WXG100 family type VII secretion target n=1 Tax=Nocardioides sp. Kera G14 TaxID=2884264 RepID=UPI001D11308F|nr:WXG100 family type VII secretion target [Nocardioides sp. Kera G14]UDY23704.1 WXG100 family type VII secretion target [Nocardioides sp. Kera G14]
MSATITGQVTGALDRAATLTLAAKADLDAQLVRLGQELTMGSGTWSGAGANAFQCAFDGWATQQRRLLASLQWFHDQLRAIEALNAATDAGQAGSFGTSGGAQ